MAEKDMRKRKAVIAELRITALYVFHSRFPYTGITRTGSKGLSAHPRRILEIEFGSSQPISSPSKLYL